MKYADGVSRESNELRCHAKKNCAKGGCKRIPVREGERERGKNEKTVRHDKHKREKRQQKGDARQEGGDSSGKTCRRTTMYNEMPTKADTSRRKEQDGGESRRMCERSNNRQQEHKYYKQFNIILMPCHVVLCLCSYAAPSATPPPPASVTHTHTHTYIFTCVFIWHVSSVYKIERQLSMCLRHDRLLRLDSSSS